MNKKRVTLYILLSVIAGGALYTAYLKMPHNRSASERPDRNVQVASEQPLGKSLVHLYFLDRENAFLTAEQRELSHSADLESFCKTIIDALTKGSAQGLMRTLPEGTTLKALYVTPDGTAYVDLSGAVKEKHPGGSQSELMTVYSIVNSLILNIPQITAVKLLIDGHEAATLAGHMDLRDPFKANMLLVR